MMHKRYLWPTAEERARERAARKLGCVLSRIRREKGLLVPERGGVHIHHLTNPGKRLGHSYSVPLHAWYHERVVPYPLTSIPEARERYGASLKDGSKALLASHGVTQLELWQLTQQLLGLSDELPKSKRVPRRVPQTEAEVSQ